MLRYLLDISEGHWQSRRGKGGDCHQLQQQHSNRSVGLTGGHGPVDCCSESSVHHFTIIPHLSFPILYVCLSWNPPAIVNIPRLGSQSPFVSSNNVWLQNYFLKQKQWYCLTEQNPVQSTAKTNADFSYFSGHCTVRKDYSPFYRTSPATSGHSGKIPDGWQPYYKSLLVLIRNSNSAYLTNNCCLLYTSPSPRD